MKAKRWISVLLVLCMLLGAFPVSVLAADNDVSFSDVTPDHWYYDSVSYAYEAGLMDGTGDGNFSPELPTTRGMIVTILHRMEKTPAAAASDFSDVERSAYYAAAVDWAAANAIVTGYDSDSFGPNDPITREQLAAILFRYAKYKNMDVSVGENTNILSYDDAFDISAYAIPAIQWACGAGLISGVGNGRLDPKGTATRAQVAAVLTRLLGGEKEKTEEMNPVVGTVIPPVSDGDHDTIADHLELRYGTDPNKADTDGDGLRDDQEGGILGCHGAKYDTDGDGTHDGLEDPDGDGISNLQELKDGTDPNKADTDNDGLSDLEEKTAGTDPLKKDSDGDGMEDGWEAEQGLNPAEKESSVSVKESLDLVGARADVQVDLPGGKAKSLKMEAATEVSGQIPGMLCSPVELTVDGNLPTGSPATLRFTLPNNSPAGDTADFDPTIYHYNEQTQSLEEIPTTYKDGVASATLSHFSTYILLNKTEIDQIRANIQDTVPTGQPQQVDMVIAIDDSRAMKTGDPDGLRFDAAQALVDQLGSDDRAAIVEFLDYSSTICGLTENKTDLTKAITDIKEGNSGGLMDSTGAQDLAFGASCAIDEFLYNYHAICPKRWWC